MEKDKKGTILAATLDYLYFSEETEDFLEVVYKEGKFLVGGENKTEEFVISEIERVLKRNKRNR